MNITIEQLTEFLFQYVCLSKADRALAEKSDELGHELIMDCSDAYSDLCADFVLDTLGLPKDNTIEHPFEVLHSEEWPASAFSRDHWLEKIWQQLETLDDCKHFIEETTKEVEEMGKQDWWSTVQEFNESFL